MTISVRQKRRVYFLVIGLLVMCTLLALSMDMDLVTAKQVRKVASTDNIIWKTIIKLEVSLEGYSATWMIMAPLLFVFYRRVLLQFSGKREWPILTAAGLFSLFMVVGYSLYKEHSFVLLFPDPAQVIKSVVSVIGYFVLFYCCIKQLFLAADRRKLFAVKVDTRTKHPFLVPFLAMLVCWIPYLVIYFPGVFMGDTNTQICQFFQIPSGTSNYLNLISEDQLINNHHPVLHTMMLGGFTWLGEHVFHSVNWGIFCYTLLQYVCCAATLAWGLCYLKKLFMPRWFWLAGTVFMAVYPTLPRYAILLSKDTFFGCFALLFVIFLAEFVRSPELFMARKRNFVLFGLVMLGCMMFRNNGLYLVLFSLPAVLFARRRRRLVMSATFLVPILLYLSCTHILYPALQITPGSVRETLSVPFQQTARYVRDHGDEVTKEEREAIDGVLDYDSLAELYDPEKSDAVKETYKEDATKEDRAAYFKAWFSMFWKHPGTYLQATASNYYGYVYFGTDQSVVRYYGRWSEHCMGRANRKGFDFHHDKEMKKYQKGLETYSEAVLHMPVFSMLQSDALYTWMIILCLLYFCWRKCYRYMAVFLPALSVLVMCFLSPVNGHIYFRYMLPLMYMAPVLLAVTLYGTEKEKNNPV